MKPITLQDLAPLEAMFDPAYPQTLREIATSTFMHLLEVSQVMPDDPMRGPCLAELALGITNRLSNDHGGCNLYLPKAVSFYLSPRNRKMCAEFRGDYKALARKYKLTEQQVRNIVDAWQREQFFKRQGRLPGLDDA